MAAGKSQSIILRLGTRGSLLAQAQSRLVADNLARHHDGLRIEMVLLKTSGDQIVDRPLHEVGGKGLFIKELEQALLAGEIDLAVHSFKDVPITFPLVEQAELIVAAVPEREDPHDVLASPRGGSIDELPHAARVGTGSFRRRSQLLACRSDLRIDAIRGNIDTRLRKLRDGHFDAIILAMAGLSRTGLFDPAVMTLIPEDVVLPAPGQGALALQCRRSDERTRELLQTLNDNDSALCVRAERALVSDLQGDCLSPIGALATIASGRLRLRGAVGARNRSATVLRAEVTGSSTAPEGAARELFQKLQNRGAMKLLHGRD